jgi:hypothetical protein
MIETNPGNRHPLRHVEYVIQMPDLETRQSNPKAYAAAVRSERVDGRRRGVERAARASETVVNFARAIYTDAGIRYFIFQI